MRTLRRIARTLVLVAFVSGCEGRTANREGRLSRAGVAPDASLPPPEDRTPPKLRLLSAVRIQDEGRSFILLRDPFGYAAEPMILTGPGFVAASSFDGTRTLGAIAGQMDRLGSVQVSAAELSRLAESLDGALLLDSPRFLAHRDTIDAAFRAAKVRPAANAGNAYPADPTALHARLDGYFGAPGLAFGSRRGPLRAIVAPHIDPRHGDGAYVAAYRELAQVAPDADLLVLVGTAHAPIDGYVALTRKDYGTPIGDLPAERGAVEFLAARLGAGAFRNEWAHRTEHADEFQAVFLEYVYGRRRAVRAVPILVGSLDEFIENGRDPLSEPEVRALVEGLRALDARERAAGRRVVFVAGVDLTHRGTRFGDPAFVEGGVEIAQRGDRPFLQAVLRGDAEAALADVRRDRGQRRYCGFAPLYVLAAVLGRSDGVLLAQGADLSAGSLVTFAAGAIR